MVSPVNEEEEQADLPKLKIQRLILLIFPSKTQVHFRWLMTNEALFPLIILFLGNRIVRLPVWVCQKMCY